MQHLRDLLRMPGVDLTDHAPRSSRVFGLLLTFDSGVDSGLDRAKIAGSPGSLAFGVIRTWKRCGCSHGHFKDQFRSICCTHAVCAQQPLSSIPQGLQGGHCFTRLLATNFRVILFEGHLTLTSSALACWLQKGLARVSGAGHGSHRAVEPRRFVGQDRLPDPLWLCRWLRDGGQRIPSAQG